MTLSPPRDPDRKERMTPAVLATTDRGTTAQLATISNAVPSGLAPDLYHRRGFTSPPPTDAVLNDHVFINTPFSSLSLYLPTLTNPVAGHHGGFNAAALIVNQFGVICILLPYLDQAEYDFINIELNGTDVAFHIVSDDEAQEGKAIVLFINSSRFIDQANNTLQAFVTQVGGNKYKTDLFNILADRQLPVGRDPLVSTPYNENMAALKFTDPQIEDFGIITRQQATLGVEVEIADYPLDKSLPQVHWRQADDVIIVSLGGVLVTHTVTAFEAASTAPIRFTIYFGTWSQLTDGVHIFEWYVRDKVENHSPGFSPPRLIYVDAGTSNEPLLPPVFASDSDYDPVRDLDFIDIRQLTGDTPLELMIRNQGYLVGDTVIITIRGLSADDAPSEKIINYPITSITPIRVEIFLDLGFLLPLAGGRILITYKRVRAGTPDRPSHGVLYAIDGEPVEDGLAAPRVLELVDGALPANTNPVRIVIPNYFGQYENDRITLSVTGLTADGRTVYATFSDLAGVGDLTFLLENPFFAQLNGGYFVAFYEVNGSAQRPPSESVTIPVGDAQAILPAPRTVQATPPDYTFDPAINLANLDVRVDPHPVIVEGASVRLHAIGSRPDGSFISNWFPIDHNWEGYVLPFSVPRLYVLANLNHTMKLYYEVSPAPDATSLFSRPLVIKVGMALKLPTPPTVLEATSISPSEAELNPLHVHPPSSPVVTVRVLAVDLLPSDDVTLHIVGVPGLGEPIIPSKPGTPDAGANYITFTISSNFVAAYLGRSCEVFYTVTRDGEPVSSAKLTLRVTALPANTLDVVSVPEASAANVITVSAINHVQVTQWPFFRAGQAVFIFLEHVTGNAVLRNGLVVTAAEFTAARTRNLIPSTYLSPKPNNSVLTIKVLVSLDGTQSKETAVNLNLRSYTLRSVAPLTIDTSQMTLNGEAIVAPGWPRNGQDYAGNAQTRTASGGMPPYRYTARNTTIATVGAASGKVTGMHNGSTVIDVQDQLGSSASYTVVVSNVWQLVLNNGTFNYSAAIAWRNTIPGAVGMGYFNGVDRLERVYGPASQFPVPYDSIYWTGLESGCDSLTRPLWDTRIPNAVRCLGLNTQAHAWCITPVRP